MKKVYLIQGGNIENKVLLHHYSQAPDTPKLISGNLKAGVNKSASYTIKIDCTHKNFNDFYQNISHLQVISEDETGSEHEEFYGRLVTPSNSLNDGIYKTLIFEGRLGYLNDSRIRPKEYHDYSVENFLDEILAEHNSQVEDYKKIYRGRVTVSDNLYRMSNYENTLSLLLDRLPNRLGGFLSVNNREGINYLDYELNIGEMDTEPIVFGYNMLSFTQEDKPPLGTVLIPLGANLSDGTEESQVGNNLTIKSVNNGKDYIESPEAIAKYGRIVVTNTWDDVNHPDILLEKGKEYLKEIIKPTSSIEMTFADLINLQGKVKRHNLGDYLRVVCEPFGIDEYYRIIEMTIDLNDDPTKCSYVFGTKSNGLTDTQIMINNTQRQLETFFNDKGLNASFLNGCINMLSNNLRAMVRSAEKHNAYALLFECTDTSQPDLYGAMAIGTKGFLIADEKDEGGNWKWSTFGTAKGFTASKIVTGVLSACKILNADGSFQIDLNKKGGAEFYTDNALAIRIQGPNIKFFDSGKEERNIGSISTLYYQDGTLDREISLFNRNSSLVSIGYSAEDEAGTVKPYMRFDKYKNRNNSNMAPITVHQNMGFVNYNELFFYGNDTNIPIGLLALGGDNDMYLLSGTNWSTRLGWIKTYDPVTEKATWDYNLEVSKEGVKTWTSLKAYGDKQCVQVTEDYGEINFSAVEDIGAYLTWREYGGIYETKKSKYSKDNYYSCVVNIPDVIRETIDTKGNYSVELTPIKSFANITIWNTKENCFLVKSTEPCKFDFVLTGRRKGYENRSIEEEISKAKEFKEKNSKKITNKNKRKLQMIASNNWLNSGTCIED